MLVALISQKDKEVKSFWEGRGEGKLLGEKERYCCNLLRSMCSKFWFLLSPFVRFSVKNQGKWVQHFIDNMVEVRMDVCTASEPACHQK